jgi:hypothetical protein
MESFGLKLRVQQFAFVALQLPPLGGQPLPTPNGLTGLQVDLG